MPAHCTTVGRDAIINVKANDDGFFLSPNEQIVTSSPNLIMFCAFTCGCLLSGLPQYNIPSIEPLVVPMVMLEQGTQAVNYKAKLKNIKVYGLSNYDVKDVK